MSERETKSDRNTFMEPATHVRELANAISVKLRGKGGVETALLLRDQLMSVRTPKDIALDWEESEHVDASLLQVLLAWKKEFAAKGRRLSVAADNPRVREYLRWSGLAEQFPLSPASAANDSSGVERE